MPVTGFRPDMVGRIHRRPPAVVVMHQNVSVGQAWCCRASTSPPGQQDRLRGPEFPLGDVRVRGPSRVGAEVVTVPSDDGIRALERFLAAIDERTLLVPLSHVIFRAPSSRTWPRSCAAARVGALVVADIYQSAGGAGRCRAWDVDFATGGSREVPLRRPGAGYLYVAPGCAKSWRRGSRVGWRIGRPLPSSRERSSTRTTRPASCTAPRVPALYAAQAGYEIVTAAGVDASAPKSMRQSEASSTWPGSTAFRPHAPERPSSGGAWWILDVPTARRSRAGAAAPRGDRGLPAWEPASGSLRIFYSTATRSRPMALHERSVCRAHEVGGRYRGSVGRNRNAERTGRRLPAGSPRSTSRRSSIPRDRLAVGNVEDHHAPPAAPDARRVRTEAVLRARSTSLWNCRIDLARMRRHRPQSRSRTRLAA